MRNLSDHLEHPESHANQDPPSFLHATAINVPAHGFPYPFATMSLLTTVPEKPVDGRFRRVRDEVPIRVWAVATIGLWERAVFWGTTGPWRTFNCNFSRRYATDITENYMQHEPVRSHDDTPGALGLGQANATRLYCAFYIGYYVCPLPFAILSDNHLGRYKTLLFSLG